MNNPPEEIPEELHDQKINADNNTYIYILYITLGIVVILLLIWIVMITFFGGTTIKILNDMTNTSEQLEPVSDI